jgi:hypothetical protein
VLEHCPYKNYMKPLSHLTAKRSSHRGEETSSGLRPLHPVIDYSLHAPAGDLRAANNRLQLAPPALTPSFRQLSRDFLATEMKRDYVAEALFFGVMVGVSAWPMISLIEAMARLVK